MPISFAVGIPGNTASAYGGTVRLGASATEPGRTIVLCVAWTGADCRARGRCPMEMISSFLGVTGAGHARSLRPATPAAVAGSGMIRRVSRMGSDRRLRRRGNWNGGRRRGLGFRVLEMYEGLSRSGKLEGFSTNSRSPAVQEHRDFSEGGMDMSQKDEGEDDDVFAEGALEDLLAMPEKNRVVVDEDKQGCIDADTGEERQTLEYLETWQVKKMVAAAGLGAHCVNVEALAADVGLHRSDVLAWIEKTTSKTVTLDTGVGSYMEDVHILEEEEEPAKYVPPPPIPAGEVNMRNRVENLMYTLKDFIPGPLTSIVDDEMKWKATGKLFHEAVELQNPLFCLRGKDRFLEWMQLLSQSGLVIYLHDIYYENITTCQLNRWVYVIWTATLTKDLPMSTVQLGLTDCWARHQSPLFANSQHQRDSVEFKDKLSTGHEGNDEQYVEENHVAKSLFNGVLQLSGESKFEMDESGQVTNVFTRWFRLAKQDDRDLGNAKLWLTGLLNRALC